QHGRAREAGTSPVFVRVRPWSSSGWVAHHLLSIGEESTMRKRLVLAVVLLLTLLGGTGPSSAADRRVAQLAPKYRQWLEDVALLLRKEEREAFLAIKEDYQRDGFINK